MFVTPRITAKAATQALSCNSMSVRGSLAVSQLRVHWLTVPSNWARSLPALGKETGA
jgi:hypothetical protein